MPSASARRSLAGLCPAETDGDRLAVLLDRLHRGEDRLETVLEEPVKRLAAHYLTTARGRRNRARDPVAHFHLNNGARIERLNWMADRSRRGREQSHGLMVNYLYRVGDIGPNSASYVTDSTIAQSSAVRSLARN